MTEEKAREILDGYIRRNDLYGFDPHILWWHGDDDVHINGNFTAEQLEAIAWWMRNK